MLATAWQAPFSDDDWLFEPKWDGYRVLLTFDGTHVSLRSRRGNDVTSRYPEITRIRPRSPIVLDGEVVVLDDGTPSFERLQQRSGAYSALTAADHPVSYVVFDVLHVGDRSVVSKPLEARLELLGELDLDDPFARAEPVHGAGLDLWEAVLARDLEGMVAKRRGSTYRPGVRSEDWRKIHHVNSARAVVGGFTTGEGGRSRAFGALLVGLWDGTELRWCGAVGTGFSDPELRAIRATLDELERDTSPFHDDSGLPTDATWVEPVLVASIGFRNWTTAGRLRHPRFRGFTDDPPETVTLESERPD